MANPLSLLRQYYVNKKEVVQEDQKIVFGEFVWPKTTSTNYLIHGSGKNGAPKDYYTLECLLFFIKNEDLKHSEYVRRAAARNIPIVRRPDRKQLLEYLAGELESSNACDKSVHFKLPMPLKRAPTEDLNNNCTKKPRLEDTHIQKVKQQLAARLDAPKEVLFSVENIKSLSEAMTVDKIADIKAKRLVRKRTSVKENTDIEMEQCVQAVLDLDVADTKEIISRERSYRNRSTILQSRNTVFADNVFGILDRIEVQEESRPAKTIPKPVQPAPASAPYNRYRQEKFVSQPQDTEFKIDTTATFSLQAGQINPAYRQTLPAAGRSSVPAGPMNPAYRQILPAAGRSSVAPTPGLLPVSAAKFTPQQAAQNKRGSQTPIIIVPPIINTSLITMLNAREILQDLRFVSNAEKKAQGARPEKEVLLQRRKEHGTVPYSVVNNPEKLTKEEWERVVAVFVMGPQWQFKGFPFKGDPVEIFSKICGFHFKYDDTRLDANISRWAVSVIEISKHKRHLDRAAIMKFWEVLDKHLIQNKSHLRF